MFCTITARFTILIINACRIQRNVNLSRYITIMVTVVLYQYVQSFGKRRFVNFVFVDRSDISTYGLIDTFECSLFIVLSTLSVIRAIATT